MKLVALDSQQLITFITAGNIEMNKVEMLKA